MAKVKKSENVPKKMRDKFNSIVKITDNFSKKKLNDEYARLIRFATTALCRKRPSPLEKGRERTWACGIAHGIGMVNFLFDSSTAPYISAKELYKWFEVSPGAGQAKSKQARDFLKMYQSDPDWCLPSRLDDNIRAWMITVNGFIMDARQAPRAVQEEAYAKGLIPYIPDDKPKDQKENSSPKNSLYTMEVILAAGPLTEEFIKKNREVSRTIEIRGDQTLVDFHHIIFDAFDREDEHMYEFQIGGKYPNDPEARTYGLSKAFGDPCDDKPDGDVRKTTIASLELSAEDIFGYWFDFGDDWWH